MILGVRQCGKTYIIEEFCKYEYKDFYTLNLLKRQDIVELYNSNISSDEKYKQLKLMINYDFDDPNSILFIDEIQESESLISDLKYFCEEHNNVNLICAGSLLGVKLKRLKFNCFNLFLFGLIHKVYRLFYLQILCSLHKS